MFVCLNKVTCVRMYNYVQEYWKDEIKKLKAKIKKATQQEAQELERRLKWIFDSADQYNYQEQRFLMLTGDFFKKIIIMRDAPALYYNDDGVLIMSVYDFLLNEGKGDQTWDKSFIWIKGIPIFV